MTDTLASCPGVWSTASHPSRKDRRPAGLREAQQPGVGRLSESRVLFRMVLVDQSRRIFAAGLSGSALTQSRLYRLAVPSQAKKTLPGGRVAARRLTREESMNCEFLTCVLSALRIRMTSVYSPTRPAPSLKPEAWNRQSPSFSLPAVMSRSVRLSRADRVQSATVLARPALKSVPDCGTWCTHTRSGHCRR